MPRGRKGGRAQRRRPGRPRRARGGVHRVLAGTDCGEQGGQGGQGGQARQADHATHHTTPGHHHARKEQHVARIRGRRGHGFRDATAHAHLQILPLHTPRISAATPGKSCVRRGDLRRSDAPTRAAGAEEARGGRRDRAEALVGPRGRLGAPPEKVTFWTLSHGSSGHTPCAVYTCGNRPGNHESIGVQGEFGIWI